MIGSAIKEKARRELKDFIVYEVKQLYGLLYEDNPAFDEDAEWRISFDELDRRVELRVGVDVYATNGETTTEKRTLDEIRVGLDDNLFFTTQECDDELNYEEMTIDDLVGIADYLEEQYFKKLRKK